MNTFLTIWNKPLETYKYLDGKSEKEIEHRTSFIFILLGLLSALNKVLTGEMTKFGIVWTIVMIILSGGMGILVGRFLMSYPIYWICKLLKGESSIDGVRMSLAYAIIPNFLTVPWLIYLKINYNYVIDSKTVLLTHTVIGGIIWLFTMTFLVIGLKYYNKFNYLKAILTVSPFVILGVILRLTMY